MPRCCQSGGQYKTVVYSSDSFAFICFQGKDGVHFVYVLRLLKLLELFSGNNVSTLTSKLKQIGINTFFNMSSTSNSDYDYVIKTNVYLYKPRGVTSF